jgi:hypothetical protein
MSLLCLGVYLGLGLLFTTLYWMSLVVGKKYDAERGCSPINDPLSTGE